MAVDNAGGRRQKAGDTDDFRLEFGKFSAREHAQVIDTIDFRLLPVLLEAIQLAFVVGDDDFPDTPVVYAPFGAIPVQRFTAGDAHPGLERTGFVVDAGVYDLRVARAGVSADGIFGLKYYHLALRESELARDGEPDHAGADHRTVDFFRHAGKASPQRTPRTAGEVGGERREARGGKSSS